MKKIKLIHGDITQINDIDVIVNATNTVFRVGGGVDGAIHAKAGGELSKECKRLYGTCDVGNAVITEGYKLNCKYVIHTVGPIYYNPEWAKANNYNQELLLSNAYKNSLELAKKNNLTKIAFPSISTGCYSYPIKEATSIALREINSFLDNNEAFEVTVVLYEKEIYEEYKRQLEGV